MRLINVDALEDMDFETCDTDDWYPIKERVAGRNHIRKIVKDAPTVDAVPWMWLEVFAKTKPFDSVEAFITEAKEMNRKMYSCCCADGERRE